MAGDYLRAIHRLLQGLRDARQDNTGNARSMRGYISDTFGVGADSVEFAKYVSAIFEQIGGAEEIIRESPHLTEESKRGLTQTTVTLRRAFSLSWDAQIGSVFPTIDASISQFSIIADLASGPAIRIDKDQSQEFIYDVERMEDEIRSAEINDEVRSTILKHVEIFKSFLKNIDLVGIDAAYEAYFLLCMKLKRRDQTSGSEQIRAFVAHIWPEIERWAGRLAMLDKAFDSGQSLLGHAMHAAQMIPHLSR